MSAKDIVLRPISGQDAKKIVEREHYSGKVDPRSQLHIGVFYLGSLEGAIQFGPPIDRRKMLPLVEGTSWQGMCELNRMAFSEKLPRNSESRALSVAFRLLKKHKPQLKWVVSFADATLCGDGAIYRASGFLLTQIRQNKSMIRMPDGSIAADIVFSAGFSPNAGEKSIKTKWGMGANEPKADFFKRIGAKPVPGYQFRYIYFLDPSYRGRLTVPVIPFDQIPPECRMYRGVTCGGPNGIPDVQSGKGGENPTPPLHTAGGE